MEPRRSSVRVLKEGGRNLKVSDKSQAHPQNFIRAIVEEDLEKGTWGGRVHTRFPPEPNGYLHIGHAKSICLNFGLAEDYGGLCNLRFDDTNPAKEEMEYVESIKEDVRWLGFDWGDREYYASDYFERLFEYALQLIRKGKAYVCDLSPEQIREYRGTLTEPGRESPYRNRSVEENLDLFQRMRAGEFPDGSRTLRAKIDMASPNLNMRDPVMYRILHAEHHRTGRKWCIYPTYDWTHGQSDSIEGITHSLCTLEFEDHRPLYNWFLEALEIYHPRQIEFARLNLSHTVMSKRKLLELVKEGHVRGWDDPRMPTLCGLRRRGYTPESIRNFCERIGVAKRESVVDIAFLEHCLREDLNKRAQRVMAVLRPLKVIIDNYPEGRVEELEAVNNPEDPGMGTRKVPFSRVLYIEREDFMEDPPKKFYRLAPGREVRLRYAYFIKCVEVVKDGDTGEIREIHCTYDPETRGGNAPDGRKVKATLHWVSAEHALEAEVRLYDHLFLKANPGEEEGKDFKDDLNPHSLEVLPRCFLEPSLKDARPGISYQFERLGYFCVDSKDSTREKPVFNRTVTLRDTWAKIRKRGAEAAGKEVPPEPSGKDKKAGKKEPAPLKEEITIEEFSRMDLRVGIIREAEEVEGARKLLRLQVDLGEGRTRQILSGIRSAYPDPGRLVGKRVIVVANLKPRKMRFGISEGMILSGGDGDRLCVTTFDGDPLPGDPVT
ncbi:MAG: glutamine--tRNA ligase/YqeY domain fusion protein [Deltaproteobacteria bacterium]|nr:glutamine--tRNA ligase/YqeY domain fusion protein [Deltaproteobacteria bacterium]MBW2303439.1 glutamine--tRNA ligase/YqeY domain fusion protein [Deltaproteobacteria bacterium]